jgi:hypothetical protein
MHAGELSLPEWQLETAREIKFLHTAATAVALGGAEQVTARDNGRLGARLKFQYKRQKSFWLKIEAGEKSEAQISAQIEQYADAGFITFIAADRDARIEEGEDDLEMRVDVGDDAECDDCAAIANEWAPIGSLDPIGSTECNGSCRCEMIYSTSKAEGLSDSVLTDAPIDEGAQEAATSVYNARDIPTEAQVESGNFKKGHINISGLDISIEFPQQSVRTGQDAQGNEWSTVMKSHYGYIKTVRR